MRMMRRGSETTCCGLTTGEFLMSGINEWNHATLPLCAYNANNAASLGLHTHTTSTNEEEEEEEEERRCTSIDE